MGIQTSLSDPGSASSLVRAVQWIEATALGSVAPAIAVIAVALVGMMMFSGRLDLRRGLTTIAGCFLLFGASTLVGALQGAVGESRPPPAIAITPPPTLPQPKATDPYAGAAVPHQENGNPWAS